MNTHYFVWQTGLLWNIKHPVFREGRRWKQLYLLCSLRVFPKQPKAPARFCPGDPISTNEPSLLSLEVALTACLFAFSFGWRRALLLEPSLPEPALVILLFQSASPTQRAQKATGHQRAKTLLGMPSWKASWGGRMRSVFYFSLVPSRNRGKLMVFFVILVRSSALVMAKIQFRYNYWSIIIIIG